MKKLSVYLVVVYMAATAASSIFAEDTDAVHDAKSAIQKHHDRIDSIVESAVKGDK